MTGDDGKKDSVSEGDRRVAIENHLFQGDHGGISPGGSAFRGHSAQRSPVAKEALQER
jgi:hypothetical protein